MSPFLTRWTPAVLLALGALVTVGVDTQRSMSLRASLGETIPSELAGYVGSDQEISEGELRAAGVSDYLYRVFEQAGPDAAAAPEPVASAAADVPDADGDGTDGGADAAGAPFSLYVGFYEQQSRGQTIHSPKNCLPGSGWEALTSTTHDVAVAGRTHTVNRYLLKRGEQKALVLYWYQGRGRVEANEYKVKLDLLRDSALRGRSDEALVRLVVPIETSEPEALALATEAAREVIPRVRVALPG
jgi:EpsI family protein